jgi:thymidylate synthase (methanogen type)
MEIREESMLVAWKGAISFILSEGRAFIDDEGRECHEVNNLRVTVEKATSTVEGVRAMRRNRKWHYPSEEELSNIMLNKEAASVYDYLYGQRIFSYNGTLDQVNDFIIPLLKRKQNTRRAIISLLNPVRDLKPDAKNIVGISLIHFRVIEGRLNVTAVIRTSGFFTGWPANIYQLSKLQEYVAHAINLPQGVITTISLAAHLHSDSFDDIELVLGEEILKKSIRE